MIGRSIRARLTAWYVAVVTVATFTLAGGSWWFSSQSVMRAADIGLQARVDGVRRFLENPRTRLTIDGLQDEFGEYAELTRGEALLEVIDPSGVVLCQPSVPGWVDMADVAAPATTSRDVRQVDRTVGRLPFRVASARVEALGRWYRVTVAAPMGPAYDALNRFHRLLALLLPAVLLFAGGGGYWISRRALAPVDRMTRMGQAISGQNLDRRLDLPAADDELRRLASTFNDMLTRLQVTVRDIVRFTADASHELRTPVALVRTTAELALRHERTPEEYRASLTEVLDVSQRMSALVEDLLDLARTDAGIDVSTTMPVDVAQVANEVAQEVRPLACDRSVTLRVENTAHRLVVAADRASMRRLLLILLDNAVKYSLRGGEVGVLVSQGSDAAREAATVQIDVTDTGIGLDPPEVGRLFERFYRGARARLQAPDGSGLGLAIARAIVERHHGTIEISGGEEGGETGCRVRVRLPVDATASVEGRPS